MTTCEEVVVTFTFQPIRNSESEENSEPGYNARIREQEIALIEHRIGWFSFGRSTQRLAKAYTYDEETQP